MTSSVGSSQLDLVGWDINDPASAEAAFRAALPDAESGGDTTYLAELLTQLARTQSLQANFDEAHAILDRTDALIGPDLRRPRIRYWLERGRTLNSAGSPKDAQEFFLKAWEMALDSGEVYLAVDSAHMLGIVGEPEEQLEWNLRALEMAQSSEDEISRKWLGPLYNNIGWTYHDRGDFQEALKYFELGLRFREEQGQEREARIAAWTVARAFRSLGRYQEALDLQRDLLARAEAENDPHPFIDEEIGECLLALSHPDEARQFFDRAYSALSTDGWLVANEGDRLRRLQALALGQPDPNSSS